MHCFFHHLPPRDILLAVFFFFLVLCPPLLEFKLPESRELFHSVHDCITIPEAAPCQTVGAQYIFAASVNPQYTLCFCLVCVLLFVPRLDQPYSPLIPALLSIVHLHGTGAPDMFVELN